MRKTFTATASVLAIAAVCAPSTVFAQSAPQSEAAAEDEEDDNVIIVNARGRGESLQEIPESIIALNAEAIEARGIQDINGVVNQVPNFFARETFRAGVTFFTIRGITSGQQGWAPVTYAVDGVKTATLDAINQNALIDIERIEVLKGPQGGLYGAGAIGGAVNVTTKAPTNDFSGQVIASYAEGNDAVIRGTVSGPIVEDTVLFKLTGYYRNSDGLTDTIQGEDIDFEETAMIRGALVFKPSDTLTIDLRGAYTDIEAGAAKQARFGTTPAEINIFERSRDPSRGIIGVENREIVDLSAKIDLDLGFGVLTSTTGYLDLNQDLYGTASWRAEPALGEPSVGGLFGPIFGANALPASDPGAIGQPFDNFQDLFDNFEIFTQDIRIVSNSDQQLRWLAGFEYIERDASQGLGVGLLLGPDGGVAVDFLDRFDNKKDQIWGVFAQLQYDITDQLELTVAARYDEDTFDTRQFQTSTGMLVQQIDENGNMVDFLEETDRGFQPKVTLAYAASEDFNLYATYARGFRFGFFNTGNLTEQETTNNYEVGFRSTLADGDLTLNGSVFFIEYSDQQITSVIATPPFRLTNNVPATDIFGFEVDFNYFASDVFQINGGVGYLDAEISGGGGTPPATPSWTGNLGAQVTLPMSSSMDFIMRTDYRYQGSHILIGAGTVFDINAVHLIDARAGVQGDSWKLQAFVRNLADERFATDANNLGGFLRDYNDPQQFGVEASFRF